MTLPAALKDATDEALIARIADARDEAAFRELYARYEPKAYNLARYLTGGSGGTDAAEDAVQESMLRVWTAAATFKRGGSVRGWLLRIVARESLRRRARVKRDRTREARELMESDATVAGAAGAELEQDEALAAVREHLWRLTHQERHILAMYYGCGCTQQEIGEALELRQGLVSQRISEALATLRKALTSAGCAAALPLLTDDGLAAALSGGARVPAGLGQRVFANLAQAGAEAAQQSARVAAAKFSWFGPGLFAALCLAAGAAWWTVRTDKVPQEQPEAALAPATPVAAPAKPAAAAPLDLRFDFTQADDERFRSLPQGYREDAGFVAERTGKLFWSRPREGSDGCMVAEGVATVDLAPRPAGVEVIEVSAEVWWLKNANGGYDVMQFVPGADGGTPELVRRLTTLDIQRSKSAFKVNTVSNITNCIRGAYNFVYVNGELTHVFLAPEPAPGERVCIVTMNVGLKKVRVRSLPEAEWPDELRDPETFWKSRKPLPVPSH
ncbi:MAG: sigma-70 family RNA polymerase sigma factor [Planctomycetes bacterium]|nr:sigma-70 family RNA polymerase sigma factor [Planctomycetota bacterium]